MKTKHSKSNWAIFVALLFIGYMPIQNITAADYITINGIVKDRQTNKKLECVNISVPGTSIGTITNTDGGFSIKVKGSLQAKIIEFSHIGYSKQQLAIKENTMHDVTVYLSPNVNMLKGIVVHGVDPQLLVKEAILKIPENNSSNENLFTGFYRETIKKRRNYINISEAIAYIYKTPYTENANNDRVQVYKGRKLLSPKLNDTLIVKFQGGPNLSTYLDIVKNPELILNISTLSYYKFTMEESTMIDDRPHYVVGFKPQVVLPYPLHFGKLYIDKQNLTFSRTEFSLSMDDDNKATQAILRKKPFRMRFKPEEVSFLVTYKQQGDKTYLNYIRSEVRFKCDLKRRLFSTNYTIISEIVMTERKDNNIERIPNKLAFNERHSLSDKISSFYDPDFWEDYNIIEPTESLENAVNKLKK